MPVILSSPWRVVKAVFQTGQGPAGWIFCCLPFPNVSVYKSKRVNSDLYSLNMQRAGSTTQIAANFDAIQAYVAGKTIAELEAAVEGKEAAEFVDAVSGATLLTFFAPAE
ncbi:MAG: hypothetical protein IJ573_00545 [Clostridia bacterium]|nr:hypothetical protein [Clostridia bacterium]